MDNPNLPSGSDVFDSDLALALQLQAMEDAQGKGKNTDSEFAQLLKQQEEADLELAMKLQQKEYTPPPAPKPYLPPPVFSPSYNAPLRYDDNEPRQPPSAEAVKRIMSDYNEVLKAQNPQIHVFMDEDDVTHLNALIIGPEDTPYENGYFHFDMRFPHDYPWRPPKVTLMTTHNGSVRFNPNLYANGKVCLSILGTWQGPGWTSVQTIYSTLMSIQSLMNPAPYHNEPGYEIERAPHDVENYNQAIQHETLRVAVCGMLEQPTSGEMFVEVTEAHFLQVYHKYLAFAEKLTDQDGKAMKDPFGEKRGKFGYKAIIQRLKQIKAKLEAKNSGAVVASTADPMQTDEPKSTESVTEESKSGADDHMDIESKSTASPTAEHKGDPVDLSATFKGLLGQLLPNNGTGAPVDLGPVLAANQADTESITQMLMQTLATVGSPQAFTNGMISLAIPKKSEKPKPPPLNRHGHHHHEDSGPKVKPPKLEDLAREEAEDPDFFCLVCRARPKEFVTLPNCAQPHVYCVNCANKLLQPPTLQRYRYYGNTPNHQKKMTQLQESLAKKKQIQCVLCKSVNLVDSGAGLDPLRRIRKRRKTDEQKQVQQADPGMCLEHNDTIIMFCSDFMQLMCPQCLASEQHSKHQDSKHMALDDAAVQVKQKALKAVTELKQKRGEQREFIQAVEEHRGKLNTSNQQVQQQIRDKIEALKRMIDQKGEELIQQAKSVYTSKQAKIDGTITRTKKRLAEFDSCIDLVESANGKVDDPLVFLRAAEDTDDEWRQCLSSATPTANASWFGMAKPRFELVEDRVKHLKYRDRTPSTTTLSGLGIPTNSPFFDTLGEMLHTGDDGYDSEGMDYGADYSDEEVGGEEEESGEEEEGFKPAYIL